MYAYDEVGSLVAQTDANQHTTTYEYDRMGRRVKRTLPLNQVETYAYDLAGNLTNKVDFNGRTMAYGLDGLNRLLSKTPDAFFGAPAVTFTYTATGQRESMSDASGSTHYYYNERDWLTNKTVSWNLPGGGSFTSTLNYAYDGHGNLLGIYSSNTNGVSLGYGYDALNRLESVVDGRSGTTTYSYDAVGNLSGYSYPNGVGTTNEFDGLNRLTNLVSRGSGGVVASYGYTVGPSGHRRRAAESVHTTNGVQTINRVYSYDALYRLTGESLAASGPVELPASSEVGYTLDDVGNRLTRTSSLPGVSGQVLDYDANDRLSTDGYDNNGNTVSSALGTDAYDFEDRLVSRNGGQISLGYDGDGNRVRKTITTSTNTVTTFFLVDERNPSGYAQVLEEHVSLNSQPSTLSRVYTYGHDLLSQEQLLEDGQGGLEWVVSFYGYDGHGNVRYLTSGEGELTDTYDYDAFGNLVAVSGSTPNSYLYCGEQFDAELGLYYNRARYLNADSGRFWTKDSDPGTLCDPISLHRYLYARINPVTFVDPSGKYTLTEVVSVARIGTTIANIAVAGLIIYTKTVETGPGLQCWNRCMDERVNGLLYGFVAFFELTASVSKTALGEAVPPGASPYTSFIRYLSVNGWLRPYSTQLANWIKRGNLFRMRPIVSVNAAYFALSGYIGYSAITCGWRCSQNPNSY